MNQNPLLSDAPVVTEIRYAVIMPPEFKPVIRHLNRPEHGLAYSFAGGTVYTFEDGTSLKTPPKSLIYLPKNRSYHVTTSAHRGYTACINFQLLENGSGRANDPFLFTPEDTASIERCFSAANRAWLGKAAGYECRVMANLYEILSVMRCEAAKPYYPSDQYRRVDETVDYIRRSFTLGDVPIEKLAAMAGMSDVYYRRLFKTKYGVSPVRFIQNLRVERAKELIQSSSCTVETARKLAGYGSVSYFCRQFRQITGMTPSEYRARFGRD